MKICRNCGEPFIPEAWQRHMKNCEMCLYIDRDGREYHPLLRRLRQGLRRIESNNRWERVWTRETASQAELQSLIPRG